MKNRRSKYLLVIPNILFLIYWGVLLFFNRFSQDDYGFLAGSRSSDAFSFVSTVYNSFSGRFVRYFIYWVKYRILNHLFLPWLYPAFIYIITILSIVFIGRQSRKGNNIILLGILCYNLLIFCNMEFCAFFWTAAVDYYATAFLYPLWLYYFCFICKNRIWSALGIFACSLLIGGGCEAHSPLFLYAIFFYFCYCLLFKKKIDSFTKNKLIASFVLIFIGFIIVLLAPGSAGRVSMYTDAPTISGMLIQSFKSFAVLAYLLAFRLPFLLILFALSYLVGTQSEHRAVFNLKTLIFCIICFIGMMWISTFPAAYGMGNLGFQRIYTPEVSTLIVLCSVAGYKLGQSKNNSKKNQLFYFAPICSAILSLCIIVHIFVDAPTAKAYSEADKERIATFLSAKNAGNTKDLYFKSLPVPNSYNVKSILLGFLGDNKKPLLYYPNGICSKFQKESSTNPDVSFGNDCMISFYNLPFYIYNE